MKSFYKTFLLLFLNVSLLVFNSFSQQAPGIEWQNTIGGSGMDGLSSIQQTNDGGYICGGWSASGVSGDKIENNCSSFGDFWVVKLDSFGSIMWQNTIGGDGTDNLMCVQQTNDGGYILGGSSDSYKLCDKSENTIGSSDYWVVKLNSSGNIQWENTIGGTEIDHLRALQQTADNGYIIGGFSKSNISGDKIENCIGSSDYWIVKLDSMGNIQWQNTIGGNSTDELFSIKQTTDGGYIAGGYSASNISGDKTENSMGIYDFWILKLDAIGNIQWQNTIGGSTNDKLREIQPTKDGGYIVGGTSSSNISGDKTENNFGKKNDYWILKLDNLGNILWQNTIGGTVQDYFSSIKPTSDGGYIVGGYSSSNVSGDKTAPCIGLQDYWVIKLDSIGNIQWQKTIGGTDDEQLGSIQETTDGGYILGGLSRSDSSGDKTENCHGIMDYWIIKLLPDTITSTFNIQHPASNINISPNPSSGIFQITFPSSNTNQKTNYTLEVISTLGQTVFSSDLRPDSYRVPTSDFQTQIDVSFLPKGMYVLRVNNGAQLMAQRIVIQ